ncbi:MAG TPA: hypothetical protein VHX59_00875 [Mycobacteriales bacterium]|jgi:hypothetical protein|nr:hypothetical protein [Mycobacteriales bacterium]
MSTARIARIGGLLDDWAIRVMRQLDADTPYSESLIVQDVILDPEARRACGDYCGDLSGRYLESVALTRLPGRLGQGAAGGPGGGRRAAAGREFRPGPAGSDDRSRCGMGERPPADRLITFADAADGPLREDVRRAAERLVDNLVTAMAGWLDWFADPQNQRLKFSLDFLSTLDPLVEWYRRTGDLSVLGAVRSAAAMIPKPLCADPGLLTFDYPPEAWVVLQLPRAARGVRRRSGRGPAGRWGIAGRSVRRIGRRPRRCGVRPAYGLPADR